MNMLNALPLQQTNSDIYRGLGAKWSVQDGTKVGKKSYFCAGEAEMAN